MIVLQMASISLPIALLISAGGIILTLLVATWRISSRLATVSTKLDGLDHVKELTGQLGMIDVGKAASVPDDISEMSDDIDEVAESVSTVDEVADSVDTIERSVTNIDFEGIELALDNLVDGGLPAGNSVKHELEEAGITVVISLSSLEDDETEVSFRFEENIGTRRLAEPITEDDELATFEKERFGAEPRLKAISPRQIEAVIPSSDMDAVVDWVAFMIEKFDEHYLDLRESKDEFDRQLEESLK